MRKYSILTAFMALFALASCGGSDEGGAVKGDPVAAVAPPAGKQWTDMVSKTEEGYKIGNPAAKVSLVEYGAISCPTCARFSVDSHSELMAMVDSGKLVFEFRPFMVHGIQDAPGFLLAQCNGPEAFFGLAERLYAEQPTWLNHIREITEAEQQAVPKMKGNEAAIFLAKKFQLVDFVKQLGVSEDAANKCLADPAAFDALSKHTEKTMADNKVSGTPTFYLNDTRLDDTAWLNVKGKLQEAGVR